MNAANLANGYMHRDFVPVGGRNRRRHHFITPNFVEEIARNILDTYRSVIVWDVDRNISFSHKAWKTLCASSEETINTEIHVVIQFDRD